jgi:HEAT repeat protein
MKPILTQLTGSFRSGENDCMRTDGGNIGISILTQLLIIMVMSFLVWGLLPPVWKDYVKAGPWKTVAVILAGVVILIAVIRDLFNRREHKQAHARVAKVFREATDPALQKRAALWLIDHNRKYPKRLADAGLRLFDVLLRIMKTDSEKLDRARAANALGVVGDARAVEHLLLATTDEYPYVRAEAAFALGRLKAMQAEKRLRELAQDDWDAGVRGRAKEALEWLGHPLGS